MTNDQDEVFAVLADAFADVDLDRPTEDIINGGRRIRARRRMRSGLAVIGAAAVTVPALAFAVSGTPRVTETRPGVNVDMAGWSVHTMADATVLVTIRQLMDKDRLRTVLAEAGIPADVQGVQEGDVQEGERWPFCEPTPDHPELPHINQVVRLAHSAGGVSELSIKPSAMPRGSVLRFVVFTASRNSPMIEAVDMGLYDGTPPACVLPPDSPTPSPTHGAK